MLDFQGRAEGHAEGGPDDVYIIGNEEILSIPLTHYVQTFNDVFSNDVTGIWNRAISFEQLFFNTPSVNLLGTFNNMFSSRSSNVFNKIFNNNRT